VREDGRERSAHVCKAEKTTKGGKQGQVPAQGGQAKKKKTKKKKNTKKDNLSIIRVHTKSAQSQKKNEQPGKNARRGGTQTTPESKRRKRKLKPRGTYTAGQDG